MGDGFGRTRLSVHTAHASYLSPAAKVFTSAYRFRLSLAAQNLGEKSMKVWGHTGHCSQVVYKPSTYLEIMFYELNNICHHVHPSFSLMTATAIRVNELDRKCDQRAKKQCPLSPLFPSLRQHLQWRRLIRLGGCNQPPLECHLY